MAQLFGRIVPAVFSLVTLIGLSHLLEPDEYGKVSIAYGIVYVAWSFLLLPVCVALLRFSHSDMEAEHVLRATIQIHAFVLSASFVLGLLCMVVWDAAGYYILATLLLFIAMSINQIELHCIRPGRQHGPIS